MEFRARAMKRRRSMHKDGRPDGACCLRVAVIFVAFLLFGAVARGQFQITATVSLIEVLSVVKSEGFPVGPEQFLIVPKVSVDAVAIPPESADVKKLDWKVHFAFLDVAGQPLTTSRSRGFEVTAAPSELRTTCKLLGEASSPPACFASRRATRGEASHHRYAGGDCLRLVCPALSLRQNLVSPRRRCRAGPSVLRSRCAPDEMRSYTLSLKSGPPVCCPTSKLRTS
jgi:hypothetical protein